MLPFSQGGGVLIALSKIATLLPPPLFSVPPLSRIGRSSVELESIT